MLCELYVIAQCLFQAAW